MNEPRAFSGPIPRSPSFFVVGIGAAAGGLEALERFFDEVPEESGIAFVVVGQPEGAPWTFADELLAKHTRLPILRAAEGMSLARDHVYLVSSGTPMSIAGGRWVLADASRRERGERGAERRPTDTLFRALAREYGPSAVAVVLSSGERDGLQGLDAIRKAGGLVVRDTAGLPLDASREIDGTDWVLPVGEIPGTLVDRARRPLVSVAKRRGRKGAGDAFEESGVRRVDPPAELDSELSATKELESLLSSMPDAVYFKDAHGKFLRANQAMAQRLGVAHPREVIGKTASQIPQSLVAQVLHRDDEAVLRSGEAHHFRLERYDGPEGAVEWTLVTRLPLRDRSGFIIGMIGVFHDVTEQKRAEEKVHEAVRRRDQFLAMLSHELRNPLGAIVTATALLKKQLSETEHSRPLAILQRQSLQMARLLDDLLEANRVTENTIELQRTTVDLRAVAAEACETSRVAMDAHRVTFASELGAESVWVDGDPARLQQIQTNLLQNAAKYTPAGGHVTLSLERDGGDAVLRVRDDGVGIAKEMLESVFELFVQGGRKLDRTEGGMGLGLTLVRSLVAMHGGTVSAHSEGEGTGAEFVVRLPLVPAPSLPVETTEASTTRLRSRLPHHARIAVIEDSADNRELLVEALTNSGFECRAADNGIDGLALIEALRPDVAIVDLGLPRLNGYELARRVRAEPKLAHVRLVALTGYGMREDRARALAAGFDDHLVKPVEPAALVRYLEREPA